MRVKQFVLAGHVMLASMLVAAPATVHASVRTVNVTITDTAFVPNHVVALVSQPIQIKVVNRGTKVHQFSIPYYRIFTSDLNPGASSTIQFSPWQVGRFKMISDPSGQEKAELSGQFFVTDQK